MCLRHQTNMSTGRYIYIMHRFNCAAFIAFCYIFHCGFLFDMLSTFVITIYCVFLISAYLFACLVIYIKYRSF